MSEVTIEIRDDSEASQLFGERDAILRKIEDVFGIKTSYREGILKLIGENKAVLKRAERAIREFQVVIRKGGHISFRDVDYAARGDVV